MTGDGKKKKLEPPFGLDLSFGEALERFAQTNPKEITIKQSQNNRLAHKMPPMEITPAQATAARDAGRP